MKFQTVTEASKLSGLSKSFIRYLARTKRIKSQIIGERLYLVDTDAVLSESYVKDPRRRFYARGNKK